MMTYTVKPGDMIAVLALRFKTTIRTLMTDNPFIPQNQKFKPGWKLSVYTPAENAIRHTETAYDQVEFAHALRATLETTDHLLSTPKKDVTYKERNVLDGQIGFVKIRKRTELVEIQANGYRKQVRWLEDGELLRVYEMAYVNGEPMYLVDEYRWITSDPEYTLYDSIPLADLDGKIRLEKKPKMIARSFMATAAAIEPETRIGFGPKPNVQSQNLTPTTYVGSGSPQKASSTVQPMVFERPGYLRPMMQLENAAGEKTNIELRTMGLSASYSNNIQQTVTNGGWMINIRAHNLPTLQITGFLLETKGNNEFKDFMVRYHQYMKARKTDDYYSLGLSKFLYKQTEYKGIVVGFSYTDREDETLHRKYTMQFLVLDEKELTSSEYANIPKVVNRKGLSEQNFRSDVMLALANTITGTEYAYYD